MHARYAYLAFVLLISLSHGLLAVDQAENAAGAAEPPRKTTDFTIYGRLNLSPATFPDLASAGITT